LKTRCHLHHACLLATILAILAAPSLAQPFPARAIRVISPNPAGTGQDVEIRQLTPHMSAELGVPFVVENRPGFGQLLGMEIVAKATPDGYTLGGGTIGSLATNPRLFDRPLFDVERDLTAVSLSIKHPWLLYVHASVPAQTFQQFVALAKAKPESITYATGGVGTFLHVSTVLLQTLTGTRLRHVPYGAQPWQPDLLGGHVDSAMFPLITMVEHVKSGKLRALAISNGRERSPQLPEVPQFSEVGLAQYDPIVWAGMVAPSGTPKPVIEKLSKAAARAAQTTPYREFAAKIGSTAVGSTPAEFDAFLKTERARWRKVIADNGIKLE
jgi:tripartite-type tricarboxylate transporter receptor subunit TctC